MPVTDRDIRRIRGHDLNRPEVRQALAGFLAAGLAEEHHLQISPRFLERQLENYVTAIRLGLAEVAQAVQKRQRGH
jgi:hypothetical protein